MEGRMGRPSICNFVRLTLHSVLASNFPDQALKSWKATKEYRLKERELSNMKKVLFVTGAIAALLMGMTASAQAAVLTHLSVKATGANEGGGSGVKAGSAAASFILNTKKGTICTIIRTKKLVGVTASHIHKGAAGVDGAVVVTFDAMKFNHSTQDCVKVEAGIMAEIAIHPNDYYLNVHTKANPGGAVRGQLAQGM